MTTEDDRIASMKEKLTKLLRSQLSQYQDVCVRRELVELSKREKAIRGDLARSRGAVKFSGT
jgi:hypothetical protein